VRLGAFHMPSGKSEPVRQAPEPLMVRIQPPPPLPPPPKIQPPPPKDEKQPEQAPMAAPELSRRRQNRSRGQTAGRAGDEYQGPRRGSGGLSSGGGNGMLGGTGTGPGGGAAWAPGMPVRSSKIVEELRRQDRMRKASIKA